MASARGVVDLIKLITSDARYYIPKGMELFDRLPAIHQQGLLSHICKESEEQAWIDLLADDTRYMDLMRAILFHYTGTSAEMGHPMREDLVDIMKRYFRSEYYKKTTAVKLRKKSDDFEEKLRKL